jgi:hypothetical protein
MAHPMLALDDLLASGWKLIISKLPRGSTCVVGSRFQLCGSVWDPFRMVSKCRWHPVEDPVVPTLAMTSPTRTDSPFLTAMASR